jgi:ubiquinone/menaquinone biosynthesis C-methylase UbiE
MKKKKYLYDEYDVGDHFIDLAQVRKYDRTMGRFRNIPGEIREIRNAIVRPSSTILEVGTGTGELAVGLARYCRKVIAIDVSPVMLDFAAKKAESRGVRNIEFRKGGFLTYDHRGKAVDGIVSQIAMHHIPDFWKMVALKRMAGMLKPGGRLYLRDVVFRSDVKDYDSYFALLVRDFRRRAGGRMAKKMARHIVKEYSTLDWMMEEMLVKAGFRIERKRRSGFLVSYVCLKRTSRGLR